MNEKKKALIWVCIFAVFCALVAMFNNILLPFVVAILLSYFLNPAVNRLQKWKISRSAATLSIVTVFLMFVIGLFLILIPILQTQIAAFMMRIPNYAAAVWEKIQRVIEFTQQKISPEQMYNLKASVSKSIYGILNGVGDMLLVLLHDGVAVFSVVSLLLIVPVLLFYILRDWNKMMEGAGSMVPKKNEAGIRSVLADINRTLSGFIRGQVSVCLLLAVYYAVAFSLVGLNLGALVGILTGVLSFVPYLGALTGLVLAVLLALTQGATWGMWGGLAAVFVIGQILEGYVLTPKLVGGKVGLHPAWIIFAVLGGGAVFGPIGVLLAVPVAAVIGVLVRHGVTYYKTTSFYKGKK